MTIACVEERVSGMEGQEVVKGEERRERCRNDYETGGEAYSGRPGKGMVRWPEEEGEAL